MGFISTGMCFHSLPYLRAAPPPQHREDVHYGAPPPPRASASHLLHRVPGFAAAPSGPPLSPSFESSSRGVWWGLKAGGGRSCRKQPVQLCAPHPLPVECMQNRGKAIKAAEDYREVWVCAALGVARLQFSHAAVLTVQPQRGSLPDCGWPHSLGEPQLCAG